METFDCAHERSEANTYVDGSTGRTRCRRCYIDRVLQAQRRHKARWKARDPAFLTPSTSDSGLFNSRTAQAGDCLIWTGSTNKGYGVFSFQGITKKAHVIAYLWAYGWLLPGAHVHHTCLNKLCVNPNHLEAVTPKRHSRLHHALEGRPYAVCSNGHALLGDNLRVTKQGHRQCKTCMRDYQNKRYEQKVTESGKTLGQSGQSMPHCKNGHPWTPATTKWVQTKNGPKRACKICARESYARKVGHAPRPYRRKA